MKLKALNFFSERCRWSRPSEIRELLKLTYHPNVISFMTGLPNHSTFPYNETEEIAVEMLEDMPEVVLQYGTTEGVNTLREEVLKISKKDGIDADMNMVIITSGLQQSLDLISKTFLNPHDKVLVENPTYSARLEAFHAFQANIDGIPIDQGGLQVEFLEEYLKTISSKKDMPKFIFVIPTFQNPTGVSMSERRRKKLIDLAHEFDFLIVEDDTYSKLRFDGENIKPIKAYDKEGRCICIGSFSKILAPGFRLSWTIGHADVIRKLAITKQSSDLCTSAFNQELVLRMIRKGYLEKHMDIAKKLYKAKRDVLLKAMDQYFPEGVTWNRVLGGIFCWVSIPKPANTLEMLQIAMREKVAYMPGHVFYLQEGHENTLRLNFTAPADEDIVEGIQRLSRVIQKEMSKPIRRNDLIVGV